MVCVFRLRCFGLFFCTLTWHRVLHTRICMYASERHLYIDPTPVLGITDLNIHFDSGVWTQSSVSLDSIRLDREYCDATAALRVTIPSSASWEASSYRG
jgi:hypothetical protein